MIHEGGRQRKKEAAAAAAIAAAEKTKTEDGNVTSAERLVSDERVTSGERVTNDEVDDAAVETVSSPKTELCDAVVKPLSSSPAAAAPVAASATCLVYSCSFAGCCQTFKRPGQLHRHEEKHAGPGMYALPHVYCVPGQRSLSSFRSR